MFRLYATAALLAASYALTGCGAGGPDLAGVGGSGSPSDPYVLPEENQPEITQGIEDYLDRGGNWKFPYDGIALLVDGDTLPAYGDIVYDTTLDIWRVTVGGTTYLLSDAGERYASPDCGGIAGTCVEIFSYDDDPLTSQYGTFGAIYVDDGTNVTVNQIYYGLKTPAAEVPTGSFTYSGVFVGQIALVDGPTYDAESTATIDVNFSLALIDFYSSGDVTDDGDNVIGTYELNASGVITGNSYSGNVVTGLFTPDEGSSILFNSNGLMEGAFYGPSAEETAGAIKTESAEGDLFYGGFWGAR